MFDEPPARRIVLVTKIAMQRVRLKLPPRLHPTDKRLQPSISYRPINSIHSSSMEQLS